jgi:hypothetical protein
MNKPLWTAETAIAKLMELIISNQSVSNKPIDVYAYCTGLLLAQIIIEYNSKVTELEEQIAELSTKSSGKVV